MNQQELEIGKIYPAIVTDYHGSYETQALLLERDLECPNKDCVNLVIYPVAGTNEAIKANIKVPDAMGMAGIENKVAFDEKRRIIIDEGENVSCHETSTKEKGMGFCAPKRYVQLLNKFREGKLE